MARTLISYHYYSAANLRLPLAVTLVAALLVLVAAAQPNSPSPAKVATVETILADKALWGKDFPLALASLPGWPEAGETAVLIFKDRIVGGTPLKTPNEAEQASKKINETMATRELRPKAQLQPMFRNLPKVATALKMEVVQRFPEDDSVRVASTRANAQFLAPDLTVATVQKRLGQPETVEQQVIQSEGDRRPVILTLYRYANGDIAFAESDVAARPGMIDRVILNAPKILSAMEAQ